MTTQPLLSNTISSETEERSTGYTPRELQAKLHQKLKRFNVIVAHRRFGKTIFCLAEMIDQALNCPHRNPQVAYVAPNYGMAKRIAWDYAKDMTKDYPFRTVNEHELRIDLERPDKKDRARLMLLGAENPAALRGIYLDLAVLDEVAEMTPDVWTQVIRPSLADRHGGAIFIGTPKGQNHFYDIYQHAKKTNGDWYSTIFKASETKIIDQRELDDAKSLMLDEEYLQEFECSFSSAIVGTYYAKKVDEIDGKGQLTKVPYDRNVKVSTWWDLGVSDSTAIWFTQPIGGKFHVIDYYEASGEGPTHYVKYLQTLPYIFGSHELPHDAAARDLSSGTSMQHELIELGMRPYPIIQTNHRKEQKIAAGLTILDKCWFDAEKCKKGLEALRHYRRKWDANNKVFASIPLHDFSSHAADAWQIFAMGSRIEERKVERTYKTAIMDYDVYGG